MFRKRQKKQFPAGTFIPNPARIMAILQLCFALSLFLWIAAKPFMGDLFAIKSEMLFYEAVFNQKAFAEQLPFQKLTSLKKRYQEISEGLQTSFTTKCKRMFKALFTNTSPLVQVWIAFSLTLPLLLLLKREGAWQACWILPLITAAYIIDNQMNAPKSSLDPEYSLFPQEKHLVEKYLKRNLSPSYKEQHQELEKAWRQYLIHEWGKEVPSQDPYVFSDQLEKASFAFQLARLEHRPSINLPSQQKPLRQSPYTLSLYLIWNFLFAFSALSCRNNNKMEVLLS